MGIRRQNRLARDQEGAVLVETLIAMPVLLILTFGILEFGNLMWQRQQLQIGVRDAARYWSRCRSDFGPSASSSCSAQTARLIAFTGHPDGGNVRVPGWDETDELTLQPDFADLTGVPDFDDIVIVEGTVTYQGSPVFSALFRDSIEISYWATMRYYGW